MRKKSVKWLVAGLLCFAGCVPSLHELYTDDTVVYDPAILGRWQQDESVWSIAGVPNAKSYTILVAEKENGKILESKMDGRLVELDGKRYLDICPNPDVKLNVGNWFKIGLVQAHLFLKLDVKDGNLLLSAMNPDTAEKMLKQNPEIVKHEKTEDRIILTASPKELQAFIKKYRDTEKFFGEPMELKPKIIQNEPNELKNTATD